MNAISQNSSTFCLPKFDCRKTLIKHEFQQLINVRACKLIFSHSEKGTEGKFKIEECAMKKALVRLFFIRKSCKCHVTAERPLKMLIALVFISLTRCGVHCVVIVVTLIVLYLQHHNT